MRRGLLLSDRFHQCHSVAVRGWRILCLWRRFGAPELQSGLLLRRWRNDCDAVTLQQLCGRCHVCWWARCCILFDTLCGRLLLRRWRCPSCMHDVPRGVYLRWRSRCSLVLDDLSRGVLLPGEFCDDCLRRGIVQCYDGRELDHYVFGVHRCGGLLLPCSEHVGGWFDVPERLLLHRRCSGCGCFELRVWNDREFGIIGTCRLELVWRCLHALLCWLLRTGGHRSTGMPCG